VLRVGEFGTERVPASERSSMCEKVERMTVNVDQEPTHCKRSVNQAPSDAHASSILAEVLGLASIFLPRNRLALLEPYSINSPSPATHFPLCHGFLRPSTPLASPREAAALPDDPRLASCSTRRLVCITASTT
jgi:hypothetical protein